MHPISIRVDLPYFFAVRLSVNSNLSRKTGSTDFNLITLFTQLLFVGLQSFLVKLHKLIIFFCKTYFTMMLRLVKDVFANLVDI